MMVSISNNAITFFDCCAIIWLIDFKTTTTNRLIYQKVTTTSNHFKLGRMFLTFVCHISFKHTFNLMHFKGLLGESKALLTIKLAMHECVCWIETRPVLDRFHDSSKSTWKYAKVLKSMRKYAKVCFWLNAKYAC